ASLPQGPLGLGTCDADDPAAGTRFAPVSYNGRHTFRTGSFPGSARPLRHWAARDMKHKNSHLLVGYWSRLRRGRDVPDQTDIDPRQLKRMLSSVFILDAENPARPIYRLAGTGLCERFGFELKGTGFLAHWEAQ